MTARGGHEASVWSPVLGEQLRYAWHATPARTRPRSVLYLLHGRSGSMADWAASMPAVDRLVASGAVPPLLVVMPDAPWSERASFYVDSAFAGTPRGRPVETALLHDLVPRVESAHDLAVDRGRRFVGGSSMGGAGALRLLLVRPDLFAGALVLSPAAYDGPPPSGSSTREFGAFGRGTERFDEEVHAALAYPGLLSRHDGRPVRLFVAVGDADVLAPVAARVAELAARTPGVQCCFASRAGGHDAATWQAALVEGLPFVIPDEGEDA